jgi:hypothetical protein
MSYSEAIEQQVRLHRIAQIPGYAAKVLQAANTMRISDDDAGWAGEALKYQLTHADPFFWAPETCAIVTHAAQAIPDWPMDVTALPSPVGFFWFQHPLPLPEWDGDRNDLRAISWSVSSGKTPPWVYVTMFIEWPEMPTSPIPTSFLTWVSGSTVSGMLGDPSLELGPRPVNRLETEMSYFGTCLAFLQQRILVSPQQRVERHAVKRLERSGWTHEPLVKVVQLRRKVALASDRSGEDPKAIPWTHQWVVSGHWRQQPYPSKNVVQPIWIMPYVKGPEDKPLKAPRAKVFAVVR